MYAADALPRLRLRICGHCGGTNEDFVDIGDVAAQFYGVRDICYSCSEAAKPVLKGKKRFEGLAVEHGGAGARPRPAQPDGGL